MPYSGSASHKRLLGVPLDLAGETTLIIRRLILPLTVAVVFVHAGQAGAQGAFPAPLPGQVQANDPAFPPVSGQMRGSDPAFPPVNGAPRASVGGQASFPANGAAPVQGGGFGGPAPPSQAGGGEDCMRQFAPLREDAEKRGKLIKAASDRHAPPDEACKLIGNYGQAELKMIKFVESHAASCGIPPQVSEQMKAGHKNTDNLLKKVCGVAQQAATRGPAGPSLSEVLGSSAQLPEATPTKKGGSTFDTLNGNVLTR
jgi:hypothetical protein